MSSSGFAIDFNSVDTNYRTKRSLNNNYRRMSMTSATNSLFQNKQTTADKYVSDKGNSCTDGSDDGRIGLWQGIVSTVKGVVKGGLNMLKGAVCDENGFNLFRTLKTAGIAALCIAVPAAGLALSAVGIVTGGVKVIKSVVSAANAKTDAEKKDALENMGEGGLTVGLSILGAKASAKAITVKGGGFFNNAVKNGASFTQKAGAFLKDVGASTKNGLHNIWNGAKSLFEYQKAKVKTKVADLKYKHTANKYHNFKGNVTYEDKFNASQNYNKMLAEQKACATEFNNTYFGKLTNLRVTQKATETYNYVWRHPFKTIGNVSSKVWESAKTLVKDLHESGSLGDAARLVTSKLGATGKNILNALQDGHADYNLLVKEYGYENVIGVLDILGVTTYLDKTI